VTNIWVLTGEVDVGLTIVTRTLEECTQIIRSMQENFPQLKNLKEYMLRRNPSAASLCLSRLPVWLSISPAEGDVARRPHSRKDCSPRATNPLLRRKGVFGANSRTDAPENFRDLEGNHHLASAHATARTAAERRRQGLSCAEQKGPSHDGLEPRDLTHLLQSRRTGREQCREHARAAAFIYDDIQAL
jgi:hypothetical protein